MFVCVCRVSFIQCWSANVMATQIALVFEYRGGYIASISRPELVGTVVLATPHGPFLIEHFHFNVYLCDVMCTCFPVSCETVTLGIGDSTNLLETAY